MTRRARLRLAEPSRDLSDVIDAASRAPRPRRARQRLVVTLRTALGLLGCVQWCWGFPRSAVALPVGTVTRAWPCWIPATCGTSPPPGTSRSAPVSCSLRYAGAHPPGLLPTLTAFVGTLLLSVNDLVAGRVEPARILSHAFLLGDT